MITLNTKLLSPFLRPGDYTLVAPRVRLVHQQLLARKCKGNDLLGWLDLPVCQSNTEIEKIRTAAGHLAAKAPYLVIVGIGGSYLGGCSAIEFLQPEWQPPKGRPAILFFGHHLSSAYSAELLNFLQDQDYCVCVISKSGSTVETGIAFRLLRQHMAKKYSAKEMRDRVLIITEPGVGSLRRFAETERYPHLLDHPKDVGGRFSVLSTVGLLPMAVSGIDIHEVLQGATAMRSLCMKQPDVEENIGLHYAASRYLLYRKGRFVENLSLFDSSLQMIGEWWRQLFGESEGKNGKGIFPSTTMMTTDLHSMGQYLQQGRRILFETFLRVQNQPDRLVVQKSQKDADKLNYLAGNRMDRINRTAWEATALAHHEGGVPNMTVAVKQRSPACLGRLFYLFEFSVAISGLLLRVNPFDQPGVQEYKNNMFAMLGDPQYAHLKAQVKKKLKKLHG